MSSIFSGLGVFAIKAGDDLGLSSIFSGLGVFATKAGNDLGASSIFSAVGGLAILFCSASGVGSEFSFLFELVGDERRFLDARFLIFFESVST